MTHVDLVVVGGGITGLVAAWETGRQGARVVVLEAGNQLGGKLRTSSVAGVPVDESADAFLARVPEAVTLCLELGLETELVAPATGRAYVWVDGQLRPLPEAQFLGVPTDLDAVAASGILSPAGVARLRSANGGDGDAGVPGDESVGALIRRELGDEVLDRLVAPLVGGIWAGDCDRLSLRTATPALAEAWARGPSLIEGAAAMRADALRAGETEVDSGEPAPPRPVFLAPRGGMVRLVDALTTALGDQIRPGSTVTAIDRESPTSPARWRVHLSTAAPAGGTPDSMPGSHGGHGRGVPAAGMTPDGMPGSHGGHGRGRSDGITADAVVVTTPAFAAAPLVAPHCPSAAATLAAIEHGSVVLVTMAVPRAGIDRPLDGSGFLVPVSAGRLLTACSWTSSKWPHLAETSNRADPSLVLLRASAGRDGDGRALALDDTKLVDALLADLADTMDLRAAPADVRISRWWRSFPQPRPGHLDRVATLEADLARDAPGLLVAGAWARGVGIPACVRAGRQAVQAALGR